MIHDTAEDGFHEIQLSGKQLVFVGMTVTIVFVAIFLCGVLVGRNTRPPRDGEGIETATAAGPAHVSSPASPDAAGPPAAEPPAPAAEDVPTYHDRLLNDRPKKEELKSKPQDAPPATKAAAGPTPPTPPVAVDVPTSGRPGTWFVQVTALKNRAQAAALVKRLIAKGHPAYLEMPPRGAVEMYRVRVGRYKDRREAEQVARRVKEEQFTPEVRR